MTIDGRQYELSPRRALDVLNLGEGMAGREVDLKANILVPAQGVCDSLAATGSRLSFIARIPYRKFSRPGAALWLAERLSVMELYEAWAKVLELEGGKKKLMEAVNESVEASPKD